VFELGAASCGISNRRRRRGRRGRRRHGRREIEKGIRSAGGMSHLCTRVSSRLIVGKNAGAIYSDGYKEEVL